MKKTLLLVSMILSSITTAGLFVLGIVLFFMEGIISNIYISEPANREALESISFIFYVMAVTILILAIFNVIALTKLGLVRKDRLDGKNAIGWGIYLVFTTGILAGVLGIIGLVMDDRMIEQQSSIERQLRELEGVYDNGLISKEEYQSRRSSIINKL